MLFKDLACRFWKRRYELTYNAMLHQTFIFFLINEVKCLCMNHCSWFLDDVEYVECETFNLFVKQISRNLFVISFQ